MYHRFVHITSKYKIIRGMISYSILWPLGSLIEQTLIEKKTFATYDWQKCLKFGVYGAIVMGPTMYVWIRIAQAIWPRSDFRSSVSKAITEQFTYDPASICTFLFVMSLLEGKTYDDAKHEVRSKFLDTYKVGVIYWPTVQTVNFSFVPVRNQVVCTSFFSMLWSAFLAYMKHLEIQSQNETANVSPTKTKSPATPSNTVQHERKIK